MKRGSIRSISNLFFVIILFFSQDFIHARLSKKLRKNKEKIDKKISNLESKIKNISDNEKQKLQKSIDKLKAHKVMRFGTREDLNKFIIELDAKLLNKDLKTNETEAIKSYKELAQDRIVLRFGNKDEFKNLLEIIKGRVTSESSQKRKKRLNNRAEKLAERFNIKFGSKDEQTAFLTDLERKEKESNSYRKINLQRKIKKLRKKLGMTPVKFEKVIINNKKKNLKVLPVTAQQNQVVQQLEPVSMVTAQQNQVVQQVEPVSMVTAQQNQVVQQVEPVSMVTAQQNQVVQQVEPVSMQDAELESDIEELENLGYEEDFDEEDLI